MRVGLNENVVKKVKIKCKLSNKTPDEVVNEVLWEQLGKIEDVSEDFDGVELPRLCRSRGFLDLFFCATCLFGVF